MKCTLRTLTAGIAAATVAAVLAGPVAAQDILVRYASPSAASDPTQEATIWFTEEVTKRTDGRVKFEMYLGNSLVRDQDVMVAIGDGLVEMGKIYTVSYPGQLPLWNMFNLPFTSPSPYVAMNTIHELVDQFQAFDEELAKLNVRALGVIATGGTGIVAKQPIKTVAELNGFKVRARGVQAAAFSAVGAAPVSIPWNDVYEALSKGVVDGSTNYIITTRPIRHNEVSDYYIAAGLGQAIQLELVNRDFWNALPDDIKSIMTETMAEAEQRYAERASKLAIEEREALAREAGPGRMEYIAFPAEERQKWIEASPDFFAEWAAANAGAADTAAIVETYKALEAKYTEKGKELGLVDMW
ncbi:TRAP-type C4-dicarboxylate transport system substrate-binding protein [Tepidamorphus gemmatus]|jgi:TRAP-type C4-dicarboxylate transport system substrate-binding protein|uniref:TRAP-type C4-dicarboxylate transport system substrate-binding protein n=1 Tax=Tepidamorphus gemmatus TaxID=747076 RepID=A0A4V2UYR5_9HYPH|nr:TRAP transporter substrate-binding protein DctP [Tepidamorphus gemmatus]TCT08428.1 TRAP-type C4-dicarboxylate transport system substrate-binding protein [Tepidamorphus gemmatus]